MQTNKIVLIGSVVSEPEFDHEVYGEGFYIFKISVPRISDSEDILNVMVSDRAVNLKEYVPGATLKVVGQIRSFNKWVGDKSSLLITVFATESIILKEKGCDKNHAFLDGFICKKPVYRKTPLGREIADVLIAVNRQYGKSDYIPCIFWGRTARYLDGLKVGTNIVIEGRMQSRNYKKKISETEYLDKVAYEVSANKIEVKNNY